MKMRKKRVATILGIGLMGLLFCTCGLNDLGQRSHDLNTPYRTWSCSKDHEAPDIANNVLFGNAVDVCGNYMIVGARGYNSNTGRAYILYWNGFTWDVVATLTGSSTEQFGFSVAITDNYAVVSAPAYNSNQGEVYFYRLEGTNWVADDGSPIQGGATGYYFGYDVDIDGTYCIIGSRDEQTAGRAYVYERNGSWGIIGSALSALDPTGVDDFGVSVAISGQTAVVGASLCDVSGHSDAGTVYVFERSTSGGVHWGTLAFNENAFLNEPVLEDNARFGFSVGITQIPNVTGSTIIVGAPNAGGVIYLFAGSGIEWTQVASFTPDDIVPGDYFGYSVAICGTYVLAGAYGDSDIGAGSGSAYSFEYKFGKWVQTITGSKLLAPDGDAGDAFGWTVGISSNNAIVGAVMRQNGGSINVGKVYLFQ
ncbi:MAG: hypothetical protein JXD23_01775 [Spirochaetales bacterium]|nr:hypothetical protein [Spirochaetales bacterium]